MKNIIMVLLTINLVPLYALAIPGTPSEDPVVKKIQTDFNEAARPNDSDLEKNWTKCKEFMAAEGNTTVMGNGENGRFLTFTFKKFDSSIWENTGTSNAKFRGGYFVENEKELFGQVNTDSIVFYRTFRISKSGDLIEEFSAKGPHDETLHLDPTEGGGAMTANSCGLFASLQGAKIISYTVCEKP